MIMLLWIIIVLILVLIGLVLFDMYLHYRTHSKRKNDIQIAIKDNNKAVAHEINQNLRDAMKRGRHI